MKPSERPTEWAAAIAGIVAALVTFGALDDATGAWITAGTGFLPALVTGFVVWWKKRPGGS